MREQKFKKNIPNILTTLRLMLVPLFFVMLTSNEKYSYLFALVIFCFAAITDYLDGKLARKFDAVSKEILQQTYLPKNQINKSTKISYNSTK